MRILPTLLLLTVLTAITMAITASTVSATISVTREPTSACGDAVLNGPHVVDGGCHVNFRSEDSVPMAKAGSNEPLWAPPARCALEECATKPT